MLDSIEYRQGVGAIIFNANKEVFIAKRIDEVQNSWQMPQGGVDDNEDPKTAILRELKEEIGTDDLQLIEQIPYLLAYKFSQSMPHNKLAKHYIGQIHVWYFFSVTPTTTFNLSLHHEVEFSTWKWENWQNVIASAIDFKKDTYKAIFAYALYKNLI